MPLDLPPQMQERVVCSIVSAAEFEVPANIVLAVAEKEGGKVGQWVRNSNSTYDVGPLQFNTRSLQDLAKYGITANHVAAAGCYPYRLASWRLRMHIKHDRGDLWTRVSNYHSRTPQVNQIYRADLMVRAAKWATWLASRYSTYDISASGGTIAATASAAIVPNQNAARPTASSWASSAYVPRQLIVSSAQ